MLTNMLVVTFSSCLTYTSSWIKVLCRLLHEPFEHKKFDLHSFAAYFLERQFQHSLCSFINCFLSETDLIINLLQSLSLWWFPQSQHLNPTLSVVLLELLTILLLLLLSSWSFSSWISSLISKLLAVNLKYDFDKGSLLCDLNPVCLQYLQVD